MTKYLLSIDQGTTSTRAMIFNPAGDVISTGQKELQLFYPHNGWVEQDAEAIWADTVTVCKQALEKAGLKAADIAAIGITNQRETTVVWDKKTGIPVYRAVVWQDRRTASACAAFKADGHEPRVTQKTGLLLDPYFSATKLAWILDHVPDARRRAATGELLFGTIDCYLLWKLTGGKVHATDVTNASRTLLYNIVTQEWDEELLQLFDIPRAMLPEVRDNSGDFGSTDILGAPVMIGGMAGDQQAALIGQACFSAGMVKITYGTGCFALMNIGDTFRVSKNRLLTTVAYRLDGQICYALEGSIFVAGAAVQWLRDGLGIIKSSSETEALAISVPDNGGVYLVPAFTGLGAPYWQPDARGIICGLTRGSTAAHIVRATLEAQAYQTADLMQPMTADAALDITECRVDGGMVKNSWLCQFIADILGTSLLRPQCVETTALGAAYLAGLAAGIYGSTGDISASWSCEREFTPEMTEREKEPLLAGWAKAVSRVTS